MDTNTPQFHRRKQSEVFPPIPTPHRRTVCITTKHALVVAGDAAAGELATVEVMDINTKKWTIVSPLPWKLFF